jgi:hypothetical protein
MKKFIKLFAIATALGLSAQAHAALTFYTEVSAFTNSLSTFKTDSLNGITLGMSTTEVIRPDFTLLAPFQMYGCNTEGGSSNPCGNNALIGFDDAFFFTYAANQTFVFNNAVNGFGFTYASPVGSPQGDVAGILGTFSQTPSTHFFGVISDEKITTFTGVGGSHLIVDNFTYGVTALPEPETYALMLAGLGVMGAVAHRRKQKSMSA